MIHHSMDLNVWHFWERPKQKAWHFWGDFLSEIRELADTFCKLIFHLKDIQHLDLNNISPPHAVQLLNSKICEEKKIQKVTADMEGIQMNDLSFMKYFTEGGMFMWVILGVSFLAMVIGIERYLALRFRFSIDGRRLFNDVKKFVTASDWRRAQEICRQYSYVPLAQVLGAGLAHADQPVEEMETAMESQTLYYVPKITERLSYLATLANVATLVGLLGTISGLIASFTAVGGADLGVTKEEALAGGIAIAMYTTAFGLIVAIPTLLAHMYLSNRANRIIDDIDHYATSLKQLIQRIRSKGQIPNLGIDPVGEASQKSESRAASHQMAPQSSGSR